MLSDFSGRFGSFNIELSLAKETSDMFELSWTQVTSWFIAAEVKLRHGDGHPCVTCSTDHSHWSPVTCQSHFLRWGLGRAGGWLRLPCCQGRRAAEGILPARAFCNCTAIFSLQHPPSSHLQPDPAGAAAAHSRGGSPLPAPGMSSQRTLSTCRPGPAKWRQQ